MFLLDAAISLQHAQPLQTTTKMSPLGAVWPPPVSYHHELLSFRHGSESEYWLAKEHVRPVVDAKFGR